MLYINQLLINFIYNLDQNIDFILFTTNDDLYMSSASNAKVQEEKSLITVRDIKKDVENHTFKRFSAKALINTLMRAFICALIMSNAHITVNCNATCDYSDLSYNCVFNIYKSLHITFYVIY